MFGRKKLCDVSSTCRKRGQREGGILYSQCLGVSPSGIALVTFCAFLAYFDVLEDCVSCGKYVPG